MGVEPHLGLMTRYLLLFDSYDLVFVGRPHWRDDGSVFCIYCWPSPGSPWPYFTVSDLRLPFLSPPTTRRVTVEVFDPVSTPVSSLLSKGRSRSRNLLPATSRQAHTWHQAPLGPMAIYLFLVKTFVFFSFCWSTLLIKEELVFFYIDWCSLTTSYSARSKSKSHCNWRSVNQ
jgi:hypothetical protein